MSRMISEGCVEWHAIEVRKTMTQLRMSPVSPRQQVACTEKIVRVDCCVFDKDGSVFVNLFSCVTGLVDVVG